MPIVDIIDLIVLKDKVGDEKLKNNFFLV